MADKIGKMNFTSNNFILPKPLIFSCFLAFFTATNCSRAGIRSKAIDKRPRPILFEKMSTMRAIRAINRMQDISERAIAMFPFLLSLSCSSVGLLFM